MKRDGDGCSVKIRNVDRMFEGEESETINLDTHKMYMNKGM